MEEQYDKFLVMYGQSYSHDPAFIVGNKKALIALRDAIDRAIENQRAVATPMFIATDGEGYDLFIGVVEEEDRLQKLLMPYTDEAFEDRRKDYVSPYDVAFIPRKPNDK